MVSEKKGEEYEATERASKALMDTVASYYSSQIKNGNDYLVDPDFNLDRVLELARNDSIVWGGVTTLIDRVVEGGWEVVDPDTGVRLRATEKALENKNFDLWLKELLLHYALFQNAFGELVYTPGENRVKEMYTVNPADVRIETNEHGEILRYIQDNHGVNVEWQPHEILHIADSGVRMGPWGEISIKTIWQAVLIRYHVKKLIGWLFETNQFRGIYNPKNANPDQIKRSITFLKESEKDIRKPIIFEGELEYKLMREFKDLNVLNEIMYKMDAEILNYLQVPPIFAGLPDNSNRSNSEAQERAFNTRVKSIQRLFENHINDFLQRSGYFKSKFKFRATSTIDEKKLFEVAQLMRSINMTDEAIREYLADKGLVFNTEDLFVEAQELDSGNDLLEQDQSPSRRGKGDGEMSEQIGTGSEGTTREDQITARSFEFDYLVDGGR